MKVLISHLPYILLLFLLSNCTGSNSQPDFSKEELTLLRVVSGINYTFKDYANEIWPGYDLSEEPYIVYLPNRWALYINATDPVDDFEVYPSDWPDLGIPLLFHNGTYRDLAGQFVFNFQIDTALTFAMGVPNDFLASFENPSFRLFSMTIHEGFHQYQRKHFGEIPWTREENYPILNKENTALASLEMHMLRDALIASHSENPNDLVERMKQFAAVRLHRWELHDGFVKKYEQGQEINEGTAQYVEMKSIDCFLKLDREGTGNKLIDDFAADMYGISMPEILMNDLESRLKGISISPEDMPRNRIYPVGASLGFIMDDLNIRWKERFQSAGNEVSFPQLLIDQLSLEPDQFDDYLEKAKTEYNYQSIVTETVELIDDYLYTYYEARKEFDSQQGIKVEIDLPNDGLMRFRSTKSRKWNIENGKIILCLNYNLYSLKSLIDSSLVLELHNKAISDESDWEKKRKKVIFYIPDISQLNLDDGQSTLLDNMERSFEKIMVYGDDFKFDFEGKGKITIYNNTINIYLN